MPAITKDHHAIQAMVLEDAAEDRRQSIGSMPTEVEVTEVEDALQAAFDVLEMVAYKVETIATSDDGADLQFQIELDDLGVLYVLSVELRSRLDELEGELKRVDRAAWSLDYLRREQAARAPKDA